MSIDPCMDCTSLSMDLANRSKVHGRLTSTVGIVDSVLIQ